MILYLTYWFPADARGRAITRFMTASAIGGVVGGPVSGILLRMSGVAGLAGWQWLFLAEGIPAVILGFVVLAVLADGPEHGQWLSGGEKAWIIARVEKEHVANKSHGYA